MQCNVKNQSLIIIIIIHVTILIMLQLFFFFFYTSLLHCCCNNNIIIIIMDGWRIDYSHIESEEKAKRDEKNITVKYIYLVTLSVEKGFISSFSSFHLTQCNGIYIYTIYYCYEFCPCLDTKLYTLS